ncbi:MAG: hypothetical protein WC637_00135 [Victivallales bacterium]|jgi:hypothetical protein
MKTIEDLKNEEVAYFKKAYAARNAWESMERAAIAPDLKKNFIGHFFKQRNSYGGNSKGWWRYHYVIEFSSKDFNIPNPTFKVCSFEVRERGDVSVERSDYCYRSSLEQEITRKEFMAAYSKMLKAIEFKEV